MRLEQLKVQGLRLGFNSGLGPRVRGVGSEVGGFGFGVEA